MAKDLCPGCECEIGDDAFEKEGVLYCCEPCAVSCECECGCAEQPKRVPKKGRAATSGPRRGSK